MVTVAKVLLNEIVMMDMNDKNENPLGQYEEKPPYPPLSSKEQMPKLVKTLEEYKAFEPFGNRRAARFRIVDSDGKSYGCSYAHLLDWMFDPPALLTITTTTRIFTFKGMNLRAIEKALMDEKIKEIFVYNATIHKEPVKGKPIIEELTVMEG